MLVVINKNNSIARGGRLTRRSPQKKKQEKIQKIIKKNSPALILKGRQVSFKEELAHVATAKKAARITVEAVGGRRIPGKSRRGRRGGRRVRQKDWTRWPTYHKLSALASRALGREYMNTRGRFFAPEQVGTLVRLRLREALAKRRLRARFMGSVLHAPMRGTARSRKIRRLPLHRLVDSRRFRSGAFIKRYRRSRFYARYRAFMKLFSLHRVGGRKVAAIMKKIKYSLLDYEPADRFRARRSGLSGGAGRFVVKGSLSVADIYSGRGGFRRYRWAGLKNLDFLSCDRFLYDVFIARFVQNLFSMSFFYIVKRQYARTFSRVPRRFGRELRSALTRKILIDYSLVSIAPAILHAIATASRSRSPIVSPAHFVWIDAAVREAFKNRGGYKYVFGRSAVKGSAGSIIFSRKLFWSKLGRSSFLWNHFVFFRRYIMAGYFRTRLFWHGVRRESRDLAARRSKYVRSRDIGQAAALMLMRQGRCPHWLVNFTKSVPRRVVYPVWEPRARRIVNQKFVIWLDPVGKDNLFAPFNKVYGRLDDLKTTARVIFRIFFRFFKMARGVAALPSALAKDAQFVRIMSEFLNSSISEYSDFTADFCLTLRAFGSWRHFEARPGESYAGVPALFHVLGGRAEDALDAGEWFHYYFGSGVVASSLSKKSILNYDRGMEKLAGGKDIVPRKFLFAGDLNAANFSTVYSCNKVAFVKMMVSLLDKFAPSGGSFPGLRPLKTSLAAQRGVALVRSVRRRYLKNGLRASRGVSWFNSPRLLTLLFFKSSRANMLADLLDKAWSASQYATSALITRRLFGTSAALLQTARFDKIFNALLCSTVPSLSGVAGSGGDVVNEYEWIDPDFEAVLDKVMWREGASGPDTARAAFSRFGRRKVVMGQRFDGMREFLTHASRMDSWPYRPPILFSAHGVWYRRRGRRPARPFMLRRGGLVQRSFLRARYIKNYAHYVYKHIFVRRLHEALNAAGYRSALSPHYRERVSRAFGLLVKKQERFLFKRNPDAAGRSRVFYYVQKKSRIMRKSNKPYRLIKLYLPFMNLTSRKLAAHINNRALSYQHARRLDGRRRYFKLKIFIRHILRRDNNLTSYGLFMRWQSVRKSKYKWLEYYRKFEGGLANYVWICGLVLGKRAAVRFVEAGLFYVNSHICINPAYCVRPGDVITMNPEAYRVLFTLYLSKYIKKTLAGANADNTLKRLAMSAALRFLRRDSASSIVTTTKRAEDRKRASLALSMLSERSWEQLSSRRRSSARSFAPGGPAAGKEQVYAGGTTRIAASPVWSAANMAACRRAVISFVKKWDSSSHYDGQFYYRNNNAVIALRDPASVKEFFSACRHRRSNKFNPRFVKVLTSHRCWH